MTIVEMTVPPHSQAPLHVHHREDEGFWILEEDATFEMGDASIEAHAGDYFFGPPWHPAPLYGWQQRLSDAIHCDAGWF